MNALSFVGDVFSGLVAGYMLGMLGMGSGLTFVKCLSELRDAVEIKDFDLAMWVPTVLMMVWWGFATLVFFGAPLLYAIASPVLGKPPSDNVMIRLVAFYGASFIFLRSVYEGIRIFFAGKHDFRRKFLDDL